MDNDIHKHYSRIRWILIIVLILNWAVAAAKMIFGFLSRCESMTADGLHSLSDGASNVIGLIGIALSSRPIDKDHPYGHKKYETFFSLGIAALLFFISFNLIKESISHLANPIIPEVYYRSFVIMIGTMIVNFGVMKYEYRRGVALNSDILIADSMHTKSDILTSLTVIIALVSIKLGYPILDPIATFIIALFIAYAAVGIVKEASKILCDSVAITNPKKISDIVLKIEGVKACHKIRTRGRPDDICVDLHVQVESTMHIDQAHKICYAIEEAVKHGIPEVSD